MTVTRTFEINDLTPQEMATIFAGWFDDKQAAFFSALKPITDQWPVAGWCQQCCSMSQHFDDDAKQIIAKLAEWAADPYQPPVIVTDRVAVSFNDDLDRGGRT